MSDREPTEHSGEHFLITLLNRSSLQRQGAGIHVDQHTTQYVQFGEDVHDAIQKAKARYREDNDCEGADTHLEAVTTFSEETMRDKASELERKNHDRATRTNDQSGGLSP